MEKGTYELIDSGNFKRFEQIGQYKIIRPAANAVWSPRLGTQAWSSVDAEFTRNSKQEGRWKKFNKKMPLAWDINLKTELIVNVRLTDFGHIGLFPEHHDNKDILEIVATAEVEQPLKVLNLFAYTGVQSIEFAQAGAEVCHVDASKASVNWARDNAALNDLESQGKGKIRWLVEDVKKFVAREIRRGSRYDIILLDPPSFGRGTKNELWKIEDDLTELLRALEQLMSKKFKHLRLSSHSAGYGPLALRNLISSMQFPRPGDVEFREMFIHAKKSSFCLPAGACSSFSARQSKAQ